jgi:hypothetical protein
MQQGHPATVALSIAPWLHLITGFFSSDFKFFNPMMICTNNCINTVEMSFTVPVKVNFVESMEEFRHYVSPRDGNIRLRHTKIRGDRTSTNLEESKFIGSFL